MKFTENHTLEQILESAIVASWEDLTNGTEPVLIHLEYNLTAGGTVDDLRIWSSIARGHWLLVCEYSMCASNSHSSGVRFDNGYHSVGLADTLELVMQHQNLFPLPPNLGRPGLLQIPRPTEAEIGAAQTSVREAFDHVRSDVARTCPGLTSDFLHVEDGRSSADSGQCEKPTARYSLTCSV
jgi:hypothetical protein